jgi:hypothetical protein
MRKMAVIVGLVLLALGAGCSSWYTSIRDAGDGKYFLTRIDSGAFGIPSGSFWVCEPTNPDGTRLECREVASE